MGNAPSALPAASALGSALCAGLPAEHGKSVGSLHGKYWLGDLLGQGAQAKVRLCLDEKTGEEYAVKVFDRAAKKKLSAYQREVSILKACGETQHLVHMLDFFTDRNFAYIVMQKYAGHLQGSIKWVRGHRPGTDSVPDAALRNVVSQTFAGVLHLHNHDIVHRDVKAQNVLVDRLDFRQAGCRVVLSDFGLATPLAPGEFLTKAAGTRKYWPPELYDRKYNHVVDIFALGVLLFLMSTGLYPFEEQTVRTRDVFSDGSVPQSLSLEARKFLQSSLEKDPARRPTAAQLAKNAWIYQEMTAKLRKEASTTDVSTHAGSETSIEHEADLEIPPEWSSRARVNAVFPLQQVLGDSMEVLSDFSDDSLVCDCD